MNIIISNQSSIPLYEQISSQIRSAVLKGELSAGEALPSIRQLARELRVSIITTKRAYEELESQGYVQAVPGKGSFVSSASSQRLREAALAQLEDQLGEAVAAGAALGVTLEEMQETVAALYEDWQAKQTSKEESL